MEIPRGLRADLLQEQGKMLVIGKVFASFNAFYCIIVLLQGFRHGGRGNAAMLH